MRLVSFASSSGGNCIYVGDENTHILIDAGISCKKVTECLNALDLKPEDITGLLVTHEHSDHISGLPVFASKNDIQLYMSLGTARAMQATKAMDRIPRDLYHIIQPEENFRLGDMTIRAIPISHDAAQPTAYRLWQGEKSAAVMTDLGYYDERIVRELMGVNELLLESNHDIRMLQAGPYPYALKQRILGKKGHLSNETSGQLLSRLLHNGLEGVLLGHLSKENNYPQLAYETVRLEIDMADNGYRADDFDIGLASRVEMRKLKEF